MTPPVGQLDCGIAHGAGAKLIRELSRCPLKFSEPLHGNGDDHAAFLVGAECGSVCSTSIVAMTCAISV